MARRWSILERMRRWKLTLCATLLGCANFSASVAASDAGGDAGDAGGGRDPALVAHWAFDEGAGIIAIDSSGHGHDGKLSAKASRTQGIFGGAVRVEPDETGNVTATIPGFGLSGVTFAVWVKTTDSVNTQSRVCGVGITPSCYAYVNFNKGSPFVEASTAAALWYVGSATASIADDQWHHIASVFDRSRAQARLYIDGVVLGLDSPQPRDAGPDADDAYGEPAQVYQFNIGSGGTSTTTFGGTLDEVRVYNRALAEDEIKALARRP